MHAVHPNIKDLQFWIKKERVFLSSRFWTFRKEISVLQSENYSLERQLFSYQRSLAMAQARNGVQPQGPSDDNTPSSSANGEYPPHRDHSSHRDFFPRREESSDNEYAW